MYKSLSISLSPSLSFPPSPSLPLSPLPSLSLSLSPSHTQKTTHMWREVRYTLPKLTVGEIKVIW